MSLRPRSRRPAAAAAALVVLAVCGGGAAAQTPEGIWVGQLPAPVNLHLIVTVKKGADGRYAAVLESPDQSAEKIPIVLEVLAPDHLKFTQDALRIAYDARWDPAKEAWTGDFNQGGRAFPLSLSHPPAAGAATAEPLPNAPALPMVEGVAGDWAGVLALGEADLHLSLHVRPSGSALKAGLDVIEQGARDLSVTALTRSGASVRFSIGSIGASYAGELTDGGQTLKGVFSQGGHDLPLVLKRGAGAVQAATAMRRPQEEAILAAVPPYASTDVTFANPRAPGVVLAGTLTTPKGQGPFPAVVLISGSGRNARDEEVFGHKIFLVLADHLARQGIAALRYDKRGVGSSTGDYAAATTLDFASDAKAAFDFLRTRRDLDGRRIGLVGHSEGGEIAPIVAADDPKVDFIVLLAGPSVPGRILLAEQERLIGLAQGEPPGEADKAYDLHRRLYDAIAGARDPAEAKALVLDAAAKAQPKLATAEVDALLKLAASPWMRTFLALDPAKALRAVRAPVLALNGSKDLQVPAALDLPPLRAALAGDTDARIVEVPGLNHLFQPAVTGSPAEYFKIEETMSPEVLKTVSDWIRAHGR